jgi:hypothetical protein
MKKLGIRKNDNKNIDLIVYRNSSLIILFFIFINLNKINQNIQNNK